MVTLKDLCGGAGGAYCIAELSANHGGSLETAMETVVAMKNAGADAVKLQTYTAETLTIDCEKPDFIVSGPETLWDGRSLFDLYKEAHTPWEWHREIFRLANELGMECFSTPFDFSAVDFLEDLDPPAYKIASFELIDLALIEYVASKGRPVIMSTGMGSLAEISDAVDIVRAAGVPLTLLKCTSAYPALPESMNLHTIPHLAETFGVAAGLSDHTLGISVPVAAVALGATVIEKHFTLSRSDPGPDSAFSLEPQEFKEMVDSIRVVEKALGKINYERTEKEEASLKFRRSLYAVRDMKAGELFTDKNIRSIRPGFGAPPKWLPRFIGGVATRDIERGSPLDISDVQFALRPSLG